ncbi:ligase-associated DNA damage response exonuclease [Longimicrobium sp.]|uniref:ligase-associated DNA damage response exonuclease n=1 Tax=Longimicrobium sp. TaxID=2029185 RepID=UPI002E33C834|nr:ligase-associated DNA damage response exonuclease [Longimicrobium sp.]HEX6042260.1 ligase-associated DNA damage response exonuclease [Longimicrobium sp.]
MLLRSTDRGLYCEAGDFYVDPWQPVDRAVITHAHGDHARWGSQSYLGSREGERVLRTRMGPGARIRTVDWGETVSVNGVRVSLHPAGHILGSAQVRVEHGGEVWVVSGDYKTEADPTCTPFEPVRCHTFVTESTFGLPIYRWRPDREVFAQIDAWWRSNAQQGRASLLFGYALGKAQRLLAGIDPSIGPIYTHGAVERLTADYRDTGVPMPPTHSPVGQPRGHDWGGAMVVAPPSAHGTPWMRRFGNASTAFASGWMRVRGHRRRRSVDRGFVLSDHVDWPSLLQAIAATEAECVWVTHGYREPVVRWLRERGLQAQAVASRWEGESDEADVVVETEETSSSAEPSPTAPERPESAMLDTVDRPADSR